MAKIAALAVVASRTRLTVWLTLMRTFSRIFASRHAGKAVEATEREALIIHGAERLALEGFWAAS